MRNLIVVSVLVLSCILASTSEAQWNGNRYWPTLGNANEIDTVYGSSNSQELGTGMINIGPKPGERYGRIWFTGIDGGPGINGKSRYFELNGGPNFRLRNYTQAKQLNVTLTEHQRFVPLAHRSSRDRIVVNEGNLPTIFWADSNGDYDTSRTTTLVVEESPTLEYFNFYGHLHYDTYLTSDTVHDIVTVIIKVYQNDKPDSVFALLYEGGAELTKQRTVLPNKLLYLGPFDTLNNWDRYYTQGDWRGVGREDLITASIDSRSYFYYRNDKPFDLAKFVRALAEDTLMKIPFDSSGTSEVSNTIPSLSTALTMKVFPRSADDKSLDLMFWSYKPKEGTSMRFFKGHKDFGSERLDYETPDFFIPQPRYPYNEFGFNDKFRDMGDMTGTGNRVFYTDISRNGGFSTYHLFYVMGNAMDDTADMAYLVEPYGRAWADTITANGDRFQDAILGIPRYYSAKDLAKDKTFVGTIHVIYGTDKIPVKGHSGARASHQAPESLALYPNPSFGRVTLEVEDSPLTEFLLSIHDVLGREVHRERIDVFARKQVMSLDLTQLSPGNYQVQMTSGSRNLRAVLQILPH